MPRGRPELAALLEVLPLLQLLLSVVATHHRVAMLVDPIGEVLAGHANHAALPVLQIALVDEILLLHHPSLRYICASCCVPLPSTRHRRA